MSLQEKSNCAEQAANEETKRVCQTDISLKQQMTKKKPGKSVYQKTFINKYQLEWSFLIILAVVSLYLLPQTSQYVKPMIVLEGKAGPDLYNHSPKDYCYVAFAIVVLIFIRSFFLNVVFRNIAVHLLRFKRQGAIDRFCEQSWFLVQYGCCFLWDFSILCRREYYADLDYLFKGYPHNLTLAFKYYYLTVLGIWIFHIFVIHVEKRRKDHYEMLSHHIITVLLVYGSYKYHFTRIGNLILAIMNFVDIWLALAKVLRYCGFSNLCDFTFLIFFFSWIILRHGLFNYVVYFSYTRAHILLNDAICSVTNKSTDCLNEYVIYWLIALLVGLQCIMVFWMFMILKVLYKILSGSNAEDVRSDSESDEPKTTHDSDKKIEQMVKKDEPQEEKTINK